MFPAYKGSPIEARIKSWTRHPLVMLERGEAIAKITISDISYSLCVGFACGLSLLKIEAGKSFKTGDFVAACGADAKTYLTAMVTIGYS
jgi:hypothetical protein